ncbi:MAG: periplasmic heavy metal sensor [Bacteroidetes bacterium]|nr:periplasmic heavy metal sensor [Bacteroidota bacterium]
MDIFYRNKLLVKLIIALVTVNLTCIGFIWWQKGHDNNGHPPKKDISEIAAILSHELKLTKPQEEQLKKIREDFFVKEQALVKLIRSQRDSMNTEMFNERTDTIHVKQIARRVAENEYQMELYRLEQAQQLKTICTAEQLKKFEELVREIRDYFHPGKNK